MGTIGEIKLNDIEIEWKIPDFSSLSNENYVAYTSSTFSYNSESWYLKICPNGFYKTSIRYVGLFLYKKPSASSIKIEYTLGLKTVGGQKDSEKHDQYTFPTLLHGSGFYKFLLRSRLSEKEVELLPGDVLTVFCSLNCPTSVAIQGDNEVGKCFCCQESLGNKVVSLDEDCANRLIKCPACSDVISLQNWLQGHECQTEKTEGNDHLPESSKILTDFKELFLSQEECDVVIKVKGREFSAHKAVLIARSPVFKSTFRNDMKEKISGTIDIKDCDPNSFSDFLCYIYCEDLGHLSDENVFSLFVTADKYDVTDLKEKCIEFIKNNLSIDTFCDAITLALRYSETELIKITTDFFAKNLKKIIVTVKWQLFLAKNPTWSNELLIKALITDENSDA